MGSWRSRSRAYLVWRLGRGEGSSRLGRYQWAVAAASARSLCALTAPWPRGSGLVVLPRRLSGPERRRRVVCLCDRAATCCSRVGCPRLRRVRAWGHWLSFASTGSSTGPLAGKAPWSRPRGCRAALKPPLFKGMARRSSGEPGEGAGRSVATEAADSGTPASGATVAPPSTFSRLPLKQTGRPRPWWTSGRWRSRRATGRSPRDSTLPGRKRVLRDRGGPHQRRRLATPASPPVRQHRIQARSAPAHAHRRRQHTLPALGP